MQTRMHADSYLTNEIHSRTRNLEMKKHFQTIKFIVLHLNVIT